MCGTQRDMRETQRDMCGTQRDMRGTQRDMCGTHSSTRDTQTVTFTGPECPLVTLVTLSILSLSHVCPLFNSGVILHFSI